MRRVAKPRRQKPVVKFNGDGKEYTPAQLGLKTYLEKRPAGLGWDLYICRGSSCPKGPVAQQLSKKRCPQCVLAHPSETLGQLRRRIDVLNEGHEQTIDVTPRNTSSNAVPTKE